MLTSLINGMKVNDRSGGHIIIHIVLDSVQKLQFDGYRIIMPRYDIVATGDLIMIFTPKELGGK
jgi:phosphotransferase system IIA component